MLLLDYSSMDPEDTGSDEEDTQDYVYLMPDYARIGLEDTGSCSSTFSWALKTWYSEEEGIHDQARIVADITAWIWDERSGTTAVT